MKPLLSLCLLLLLTCICSATEIRVRNEAGAELTKVVVECKKYGDLQPRAASGYQTWKKAYR